MSVGTTMSSQQSAPAQSLGRPTEAMSVIARRQRLQDIFFHRLTQGFSLLVLVALLGIIVSLLLNAWPTFHKFGAQFIWRAEWDIVNEEFGAAIAIVGTIVSAGIALHVKHPQAITAKVYQWATICQCWLAGCCGLTKHAGQHLVRLELH